MAKGRTVDGIRRFWGGSETWSIGEALSLPGAEIHAVVASSGLFDAEWYAARQPQAAARGMAPLDHYLGGGWRHGADPNPYFDTAWYLARNRDVAAAAVEPLLHYLAAGEREGRAPSERFDPAWYGTRHHAGPGRTLLAHFLAHRHSGLVSPLPEFDAAWYLATYADVREARIDPAEHWLLFGFVEGRDPSPAFHTRFYLARHLDGATTRNPLLHWREHRAQLTLPVMPDPALPGVHDEVRRFTARGPDFEEPTALPLGMRPAAKALAFDLPQFHPLA